MADRIKLDFMVLGAQKAGTTSLHDMLVEHQDIALPAIKETHFFSHADRAALGVRWYTEQFNFTKITRLVGEIDPEYLYEPSAADKIHRLTTTAKFIVVLRHPLKRAFSQYQMSKRRGYEQFEFGEALSKEKERLAGDEAQFAQDNWSYATRSLYAEQIRRFFETFPDAKFLFVRTDDLSGSGYEQICNFIHTQSVATSDVRSKRSNRASAPHSRLIRDLIYAPGGKSNLRKILVKALPSSLKVNMFLWLDNLNQKPVKTDPDVAYENVPKTVLLKFLEDLEKTQDMTGLDLSDWQKDISKRLAARA